MSYVTTPGQQQFSIDTESGDWLTANRTPDGVFFDISGLVYLRQADREALIGWLAETPTEPPAPKRSCVSGRNDLRHRKRCQNETCLSTRIIEYGLTMRVLDPDEEGCYVSYRLLAMWSDAATKMETALRESQQSRDGEKSKGGEA
jgi:hypothetical protein